MQAADALASPGSPCAGKAYFITNAEPRPFWEFLGDLLEGLGYPRPSVRLPWRLIFVLALIFEFVVRLLKPFVVSRLWLTHPNASPLWNHCMPSLEPPHACQLGHT